MDFRIFRAALVGAAALAQQAMPAASVERSAEIAMIGDLELTFYPTVWRIKGETDRLMVAMAKDDPNDRYGIDVSVAAGPGDGCSPGIVQDRATLAYPRAWESFVTTMKRPGFDLHVAAVEMGCRNLAGSPVFACAAYRERLYAFTADPGGCRNTGPSYDGIVINLLSGLRAQ